MPGDEVVVVVKHQRVGELVENRFQDMRLLPLRQ